MLDLLIPGHYEAGTVTDQPNLQECYSRPVQEPDIKTGNNPSLTFLFGERKMSITRQYDMASIARKKLEKEANRSEHRLRILVCNANFLDTALETINDAERRREAQYIESTKDRPKPKEAGHIQWIDTIYELAEQEGSDVGTHDTEYQALAIPIKSIKNPLSTTAGRGLEDCGDCGDGMEDGYKLTRVASNYLYQQISTHQVGLEEIIHIECKEG